MRRVRECRTRAAGGGMRKKQMKKADEKRDGKKWTVDDEGPCVVRKAR